MFERDNNVLDEPSNTVFRVTYYFVAVIAGKYVTDDNINVTYDVVPICNYVSGQSHYL